jgi:hypothetical protein
MRFGGEVAKQGRTCDRHTSLAMSLMLEEGR